MIKINEFDGLRISVASPDQILNWSHGEVKKPETINYRTHRAEVDGLMDERTFGPTKNYECYCGKYKKIRYKGIICDQCGVEITTKRVRRERMGHIKLACPVTHVWFAYGLPNKLAIILDIPQKKLETVIYYARYLVTDYSEEGKTRALESVDEKMKVAQEELHKDLENALIESESESQKEIAELKKTTKDKGKLELSIQNIETKIKKEAAKLRSIYKQKEEGLVEKFNQIRTTVGQLEDGTTLSEDEYSQLLEYDIDFFDLSMGAEAIRKLLSKIELQKEIDLLDENFKKTRSEIKRRRLIQRLRVLKGMRNANIDPTWIVMDVVPVLPPDLRPIIQLPGGRFATSDLNDLYRRVINRNNRLTRLIKLGAPEIILRNEKRMLQEAVDALIDNDHRNGTAVLNSRDQSYKSLSDMLRGKQGRFRQNLLGKRVDYSARSVIVAGPWLKIDQCGLPKTMALELFKPFVLSEIILNGHAPNIKSAKLFYDSRGPEVWDILEKVTKNHPVLLNRAPTLHKQGIQAFKPVLIEGNAIMVHPMVCKGFNADFDGDQMAVHVPLTRKAKEEIFDRMFTKSNILLMADGSPAVNAEKDMALGVYYLTQMDESKPVSNFIFGSKIDAQGYYELGHIGLHDRICVPYKGKVRVTTVGRIIFNDILPEKYEFVNEQLNKKSIGKISSNILNEYGNQAAVDYLDGVKDLGFKYATKSGISLSLEDFVVSEAKDELLAEVEKKENQYTDDYYMGLLTWDERRRLVEEAWMDIIDKIADVTWKKYTEKENTLVTFNESGAAPVANPVRQISGVKGLILDPQGKIVELPLRSNYKEGLTTLEYFVGARGTRKGLADTALKTAESGYLTRRLVDVAQDVITRGDDCGSTEGIWLRRSANRRLSFGERVNGRFLQADLIDAKSKKVVAEKGTIVSKSLSEQIEKMDGITDVYVRSVMHCRSMRGICRACYGNSLGTSALIDNGMAVGIIAAQAMGEAATQLTLNTKHLAGRAGLDITQGLPRVEELFEARTPRAKAIISPIDGDLKLHIDEVTGERDIIITSKTTTHKTYTVEDSDKLEITKSKKVKAGTPLISKKDGSHIIATHEAKATVKDNKVILEMSEDLEEKFSITPDVVVLIKDGEKVAKGDRITPGSIDPKELMEILGPEAAQEYVIDNIQETYGIQGIALSDVHVELMVRQMFRFVRVTDSGDSDLLPGEYLDILYVEDANSKLQSENKRVAKYKRQVLGLTNAAVRTESFLSAASFQEQVRVLSDASLIGKVDHLRGLKENVIIGRPVPLGKYAK